MTGVRLPDGTGLSSAAPIEPVPVSPVPASIPSAAGWLGIALNWSGDRALLEAMTKARPYVRSGRYAMRMDDVGPIRFAPRLARQNITLDGRFHYDTRDEALAVAREYRDRCRTLLSAMSLNAEMDAQAIEARRAETQGGSVYESAVRQDAPDAPVPPSGQGRK